MSPPPKRICLVYDCLFPNTVGGAERWYRNLAERLGDRHEVTYLTRRQWGAEGPGTSFETVAVGPGGPLYTSSGRRRIWPPLRFGLGVFWHLLRHGRRYDAVHTASFPYFSLLGARLALALRRAPAVLVVDWHEVWGRDYWRSYVGPLGGRAGYAVQALCLRAADRSFTFSRLAAGRARELGLRGPITRLTGEFAHERTEPPRLAIGEGPPTIVAAGRQIREKRFESIPAAVAAARTELPDLRCVLIGDGPERERILERVREHGVEDAVTLMGRLGSDDVDAAIRSAACLVHPSEREGYGLIVVEAISAGTPAIVAEGPENAAPELIEPGVNGVVAHDRSPAALAAAIVEVVDRGEELRRSTADWYERNRDRLSIEASLAAVEASYAE